MDLLEYWMVDVPAWKLWGCNGMVVVIAMVKGWVIVDRNNDLEAQEIYDRLINACEKLDRVR